MTDEVQSTTQMHVTLCRPMRIKLGGVSKAIIAFDAVVAATGDALAEYRTDRVYTVERDTSRLLDNGVVLKTTLQIFHHNIAGMVAQPFVGR